MSAGEDTPTGPDPAVISAPMRATLRGLADVLLPAAGAMPAAGAVDVHGVGLDRVLAVRPDLIAVLGRVLATAAGREPVAELRRLRSDDRPGFLALASVCAGGYYLDPRIRRLIGYPGQEPSLPEPGETERELAGDLLDAVRARGPIYRPTPAPR